MVKNNNSKQNLFWNKIKTALITPKFSVRNVLFSLVIGILLGYLSLTFAYGSSKANYILKELFMADFKNTLHQGISYLLNKIIVIGLAGLAVAVALKAKILNIGVSGQMTFGALIGYMILNSFKGNTASTFIVGLLVSILVASLLSMAMGALKIWFKVNEVVTAIMLNWIVVYLAKWKETSPSKQQIELNNPIYNIASDSLIIWSIVGIILFLSISIVIWFMFKKTALGFKVVSSGEGVEAAKYAGYKANINNLLIFGISGAIAGVAGFVYYYLSQDNIPTKLSPNSYGFTGIAVALVGMNNAIGVVFSGILFGIIDGPFSGFGLNSPLKPEVIQIFAGVVTYSVAIIGMWMYIRPIEIWKKYSHKVFVNRKIKKVKEGK